MRRRGYTPESIRTFAERIGVAKTDSTIDVALLEHCIREDLNKRAPRVMAVLQPLRVVIDNYPEGKTEELDAVNNPEDPDMGTRKVPFSRVLYIEQDDFMEQPPKEFFRLAPGREVRLRYAYIIKCVGVVKDKAGEVVELHCTYDPRHGVERPGAAARLKEPSTGFRLPTRSRLRCGFMTVSSRWRTLAMSMRLRNRFESRFTADCDRICRTQPGRRDSGKQVSVRTAGIFLR